MTSLVERLNNLIEVSEVGCERDLYLECRDRIEALEAALRNAAEDFEQHGMPLCAKSARKALGEERP